MEYLTAKEAGAKWGITARMVNYYFLYEVAEDKILRDMLIAALNVI